MNKANVLVAVANGTEELEAITIIDVLRRADMSVRVSSIMGRQITGALGTKIVADSDFTDEVLSDYDAIILPGGTEGAQNFAEYSLLIDELKTFFKEGKLIAAICASPALVFADHGLLDQKKATCYPALKSHIKHYLDQPVVIDGQVVTAQGPGSAMQFALTLVEILAGSTMLKEVKAGMLIA
jgi:4-methyl-5(b-hydroxyethyl)-thiazole monophosphate biosynthesis